MIFKFKRKILLDDDNNKIISETLLHALLPPKLRFMSDRYKSQCCCEYCVLADYYQNSLNRYRVEKLSRMKKEVKDMPDNTNTRRQAKNEKEAEILQYQLEAFDGNEALHPKPSDAVRCVQCPLPVEFKDEGLSHIN